MAERGGQPGNDNAKRGGIWRRTLDRAIAQEDGKRLRAAAEALLDAAAMGEDWAIKELADRLDGRPGQALTISGDPEQPLQANITVEFVRAGADSGSS